MPDGWIKLYRELLDKPIWKLSTPVQKTILVTLLLMASHRPKEWEWSCKKFTIQPGQFVTSLGSIKKVAGKKISIKNIRTALVRFEKLGFLANKSTKHGRLISIINWDSYQENKTEDGKENGKGVAKGWQRGGNYQECKNERMKEKDLKPKEEIVLPNFISEKLWQDFKKHRAKLKSPMTERSEKLNIGKIEKFSKGNTETARALIEQSIENGWKGIFPLKNSQFSQTISEVMAQDDGFPVLS